MLLERGSSIQVRPSRIEIPISDTTLAGSVRVRNTTCCWNGEFDPGTAFQDRNPTTLGV